MTYCTRRWTSSTERSKRSRDLPGARVGIFDPARKLPCIVHRYSSHFDIYVDTVYHLLASCHGTSDQHTPVSGMQKHVEPAMCNAHVSRTGRRRWSIADNRAAVSPASDAPLPPNVSRTPRCPSHPRLFDSYMPGWLSRRREDDQKRAREKREAEARAAEEGSGPVQGEIEVQTAGETGIFGEIGQTAAPEAGSRASETGDVGKDAVVQANERRRRFKHNEVRLPECRERRC